METRLLPGSAIDGGRARYSCCRREGSEGVSLKGRAGTGMTEMRDGRRKTESEQAEGRDSQECTKSNNRVG